MNLFDTLAKYQKGVDFRKSEDFLFFSKNRHLFANIEMYKNLLPGTNEFEILRANIIIQSILNKKKIEEAILFAYKDSKMTTSGAQEYIQNTLKELPYVSAGNLKIYVPIFSRPVNACYSSQFGKLLKLPYSDLIQNYTDSCVDLFETYNFDLYNSLFTKLITIYRDKDVMFVYHFDFKTLYAINDQGRLDAKIALFDKYIKKPDTSHIIERLRPVVERYLEDDKEGFYRALMNNKLISEKLIYKIKHKDFRFKRRAERKAR